MDEGEWSDSQLLVKILDGELEPSSALTKHMTPKKPVGCSLRY